MKIPTLIIGLILALASFTVSVEAYGIYGYQGYSGSQGAYGYSPYSSYGWYPYGYQEQSDFYKNFYGNKNNNAYTALNKGFAAYSGNSLSDLKELGLTFASTGYAQNSLQKIFQNLNVDVQDGYSFTKGPCVTETVKGNFKGKDNDFTLTKEVCDNIEGIFFKDNSYSNSLGNSGQFGNTAFGMSSYQNQFSNQNTASNAYNNQQSYDVSQNLQHQDLTVSFGKGTKIVLN